MDGTDDLELVQRARSGDSCARTELAKRLGSARRWISHRNASQGHPLSHADLEDAQQDAWLRALSSLEAYRGEASLAVWMRRVSDFAFLDALRRRYRGVPTEQLENQATLPGVDGCQIERARIHSAVRSWIRELPSDDLRLVRLHAEDGQSFEQIARELRTGAGGAKARYYRALAHLRMLLDRA